MNLNFKYEGVIHERGLSIHGFTVDEIEYCKRFDAPGLFPPSAGEDQRENYMLWSYIRHVRARWGRLARAHRPPLWLRLRVRLRLCWIALKAMDGRPPV
jgi:hypothetical protein